MPRYRVCVADDDADSADVLCEGLRSHNYDAIAVNTGAQALEMCAQGAVDLILLDVGLPDISGFEVCEHLKQEPSTEDIQVVFVSVRGTPPDEIKGFELGASDYICKPYNLPIVMVRVDAAMREKIVRDRLRIEHETMIGGSYTDQLTGLRNRRYLLERLQEEVEKAHRYNYPVSCLVFELGDVHPLDEELGPVSMDDLLAEVAMTLRNYSRTFDVVLPHSPAEHAVRYANKIMGEVNSTTYSDPNFPTEAKLRAGIAACPKGSGRGAEYVLGEAMRGLLHALATSSEPVVVRTSEDK